ncbi:MAG: mandelate racemase/muconate lactonizing enzyme family protein [Pirellulaceae bacterium]
MQVSNVHVTVIDVPQIEPISPYRSHVRTSSTTRSAIVQVETDDGLSGWGEHNVNFLEGISGQQMQQLARDWLIGKDPQNITAFHRDCPLETRLKSGIELALWDLCGKSLGLPVAVLLGGVVREHVEVAACMGIQSYARAGEIAAYYVEQGFGSLKTKAGTDMDEDIEMVRGVRDAVGNKLKLRIDPNRAYSPREAAELAKRLEPYNLEYLEQPIPAEPLSDATWLRSQTTVPIALNESVTDPGSVLRILQADAAEFLLPDTHIAGGILPCVTIGRICEAAGITCIMHCGHDFGPKTAAMVHVAAACQAYSLANDTTYFGLEDDILTERIQIRNGKIAVSNKPGLGIEGDPERIAKYKVAC